MFVMDVINYLNYIQIPIGPNFSISLSTILFIPLGAWFIRIIFSAFGHLGTMYSNQKSSFDSDVKGDKDNA